MKRIIILCSVMLSCSPNFAQTAKRPLQPGDIYRLPVVSAPAVSPEGNWVAYQLTNLDSIADKSNDDIWMTSWDGKQTIQLTNSPESESDPKWSPDGKFLAFISSRDSGKAQVWLLDRRGGEAKRLTSEKNEVSDYEWSPDSRHLVLVMKDTLDSALYNKRKPYVINRYKFKEDIEGYQYDNRKSHLYLFSLDNKKSEILTSGIFNESGPQWAPSGKQIVFVSNRSQDPDRNANKDLWVIAAAPDAKPRQLTKWKGVDDHPKWSPDGRSIIYLRGSEDEPSDIYDQASLYMISADGGEPVNLSATIDRPFSSPAWSADGKKIVATIEDDTRRYLGIYDVPAKKWDTLASGNRSFAWAESRRDGQWVTLMSDPATPPTLYVIEKGNTRAIHSEHNALLDSITLAKVEKFVSRSKDGNLVSSMFLTPPGKEAKNLPVIFYIHGGPVSQDGFDFDLFLQLLAARGYGVVAVNYRGSSGRGADYIKSISGDWGNKEVKDILGAADYVVDKGLADPKRLGIGGWSYGGILTDYTIASDNRFRAASSGAGVGAPLSLYGVDQYITQYENEIGAPWKGDNYKKWIQLSYPLLHADRIKTPTQFMGGEKDFNVPIAGSEQLYQALRSLNVPTELIVYPGQFHGLRQPSFIRDRFERYYSWFDKYLK